MNGAAGAARDRDGQTDTSNGAYGKSEIEGKTASEAANDLGKERVSNGREHMSPRGQRTSFNGARGTRDIEGKVTRVGASKPGGERVSIKKAELGQRIPETGMRKDLRALQNFKVDHGDQFCAEQAGAVISICDTERVLDNGPVVFIRGRFFRREMRDSLRRCFDLS